MFQSALMIIQLSIKYTNRCDKEKEFVSPLTFTLNMENDEVII